MRTSQRSIISQFLLRCFKNTRPQSWQRVGIELWLPENQVYNTEIVKNVALDPKCRDHFLTA